MSDILFTGSTNVRWTVSVPPEYDKAVRTYLALKGRKKGDLKALVMNAVSDHILNSIADEIGDSLGRSGSLQRDLQRLVVENLMLVED